jgi:hypothetical protein
MVGKGGAGGGGRGYAGGRRRVVGPHTQIFLYPSLGSARAGGERKREGFVEKIFLRNRNEIK